MSQSIQTPLDVRLLPLDLISEPQEPVRTSFEESEFLALVDSMRIMGQLQQIIVKEFNGRYEVVAGHRRLKAARYLRWHSILCSIVSGTPEENEAKKLHENAFRESVAPEDEGHYFQHLAAAHKWGVREIAKAMNRSPYYVESRLKVLTWPRDVLDALRAGKVGLGVAEALAEINDVDERRRLLAYAIEGGCNARTARGWADTWNATQHTLSMEAIESSRFDSFKPPPQPMYPCHACEKPIDVSYIRQLSLCPECWKQIVDGQPAPEVHHVNHNAPAPTAGDQGAPGHGEPPSRHFEPQRILDRDRSTHQTQENPPTHAGPDR